MALAALLAARGASVAGEAADALRVTGVTPEAVGELAREGGFTLAELSVRQATLEDRYMELTRDSAEYRAATDGLAPARK